MLSPGTDDYGGTSTDSHSKQSRTQSGGKGVHQRTNGQCLWAVSSTSVLNPRFDVMGCRVKMERSGYQIAVEDFEIPLQKVLALASVQRYLFFSSSLTHFFLAVAVYIAVWCGVYATLHLYLSLYLSDFWLLCVIVTLLTVIITLVVILVLHHSNKQIDVNTDVRLIQVNERLSRYQLLVGITDCLDSCIGVQQLICVHWDLWPCLRALTETMEEMSFVRGEIQRKLRKNMSHLLLATEVTSLHHEEGSRLEEGADEERPLLVENQEGACNTLTSQREETKLTKDYSLVPDCNLSNQETARRLLLTYSAVYVRLLTSRRLPTSAPRARPAGAAHCGSAPLCLCQYVHARALT